jgi:HK97 family phage prohead protease
MHRKSFELKDQDVSLKDRTFEGYASTWDKDQVDDIIHPGAFKKSIKESFPRGKIKVLWQHSEPLGMPVDMREDGKGLWVKGKVSKTRLGDEALELMKDGVIDSMSIGFTVPSGKSDYDDDGVRHIRELKLMEFSPVTFPANENANIFAVKKLRRMILDRKDLKGAEELEDALEELRSLMKTLEPLLSDEEKESTREDDEEKEEEPEDEKSDTLDDDEEKQSEDEELEKMIQGLAQFAQSKIKTYKR